MFVFFAAAFASSPATIARCTDTPAALPGGMPDVFRRVVRVEVGGGVGSGVVVSPDGFVLTAAHVVDGGAAPRVVFSDETSAPAEVVRADGASDLALLRVSAVKLPCLPVT